jgi:hypothetical protein
MRKMVIHFGPDSEGAGAQKHDFRDTDPARKRYIEQTEVEGEANTSSMLEWLPKEIAHRISRFERVLDAMDASDVARFITKKVKEMPRKQKIAAGVVLAAGLAGAAYLATRKKSRR